MSNSRIEYSEKYADDMNEYRYVNGMLLNSSITFVPDDMLFVAYDLTVNRIVSSNRIFFSYVWIMTIILSANECR
jgi:hypothetical protein